MIVRIFLAALFCAGAVLPARAFAQETATPVDTTGVVETIEVKKSDVKGPKHSSLRFLRDNREFLRAQLDRVRLQVTREYETTARIIDERFLRLREMSEAIAAARDTVSQGHILAAQRELLASVTRLGEIEGELALMEQLLAEQRSRLLLLEEDFLGHQETALVVIVRGLAGEAAPSSIVLTDENNVTRVDFSPEQRAALERGGVAQIFHEFVEPRTHALSVRFEGGHWTATEPILLTLEAPRDRLTFLEMDMGPVAQSGTSTALITRVWHR